MGVSWTSKDLADKGITEEGVIVRPAKQVAGKAEAPSSTTVWPYAGRDLYVGIDPGKSTGLAFWWPKVALLEVHTLKLHRALEKVEEELGNIVRHFGQAKTVHFIIEDAWQRGGEAEKAQGAGSVKRDCIIWQDYLTDLGYSFEMVKPSQDTKIDEDLFRTITGYTKRCSNHARDAAMLVFDLK